VISQTAAMNYYVILASLLVTMVITWAMSAFSRRPLRGLWLFFLVVFLATWAGQLWITPFGPQYWGVNVFSLILVSVFFSFFVFALVPFKKKDDVVQGAFFIMGIFFWIMIILLVAAIAAGYYYRSPEMIAGFYYQPPKMGW
jgi:hypothetical protein